MTIQTIEIAGIIQKIKNVSCSYLGPVSVCGTIQKEINISLTLIGYGTSLLTTLGALDSYTLGELDVLPLGSIDYSVP